MASHKKYICIAIDIKYSYLQKLNISYVNHASLNDYFVAMISIDSSSEHFLFIRPVKLLSDFRRLLQKVCIAYHISSIKRALILKHEILNV